jgi:cytochrome c biogenesis protein CcmG/thiol:disulfide interchange protein DsbE
VPARSRTLAWTLAAIAGAAALAALAIIGLASNGSPVTGRHAPALPSEHLAGPPAPSLAGGGRSKLVVFWASWCEPCAQEAAAVERLAQGSTGQGRVIGVDWSDALSAARAFIRQHRWTFPNLRDGEGIVGAAYRLTGLPTTFVVDGQGRIRAALRGPQDEASLARALAKAS